jgi:hypothetical protein
MLEVLGESMMWELQVPVLEVLLLRMEPRPGEEAMFKSLKVKMTKF